MSAFVEVQFNKAFKGFETSFPVSLAHLLDGQTYTQAITRINTAIQAITFPRPAYYICIACATVGGFLIGFGAVGDQHIMVVIGAAFFFACLLALIIGSVIKARRVRQALDSALRIENDRFINAQPPLSFRLFEQQTQEIVAHYDPNHNHRHGHNHRDRRHRHGPRSDWHYDTRTRIDWKLIVEVGLPAGMQAMPAQVIQAYPVAGQQYASGPYTTQAGFAQPGQFVQPGYAQPGPYTQQGYAQPTYQQPPSYAQPPVATPARHEDVNAPLMAAPQDTHQWMNSQESSDSAKFSPPNKPSTYLSPAGSSYGAMA